jgi:hypothetical protein
MITEKVIILEEPILEFRYEQRLSDPHDGLSMFGPYDTDTPSHPKSISYGLVGSNVGLARFKAFANRINAPIVYDIDSQKSALWPTFPGFEASFHCSLSVEPTRVFALDKDELTTISKDRDAHKRTSLLVEKYLEGIQRILKHEEFASIIFCVVPDIVYQHCRPKSRVIDGTGYPVSPYERKRRAKGQKDFFESFDSSHYKFSLDFRRQLKARAMKHGVPIQIIRESTLRLTKKTDEDSRGLTPLCDRAWNLGTTTYYKAGGKPWRLASAREGVCYIGIAYRLTGKKDPKSACCAAQMFLDTGDGIVFMGEYGPWYSRQRREFHLTEKAAYNLLSGVLRTYEELEGKPLREVFLHCRSSINEEEFAGFRAACSQGVKLMGIRVRQERSGGVRAFREGTYPLLRGTLWLINKKSCYLWTSGFKPRLGTYDGWETPLPLRIDIQHGEGDIELVARDILGLTKLDYNACRLGISRPVTVEFSDAVGEILFSNPTVKATSPKFKFYI